MAGLLNAGLYLIDTLFHLYIWVLILRILLQQFKADPYNPISQIIAQLTRIPIGFIQQAIPRYKRFDVAAARSALVVSGVSVQVFYSFLTQPLGTAQGLWLAL